MIKALLYANQGKMPLNLNKCLFKPIQSIQVLKFKTQRYEALTRQNRTDMNHTAFNTTISSCGNSCYSINLANISPDFRAVLIIRIVVNILTCPLIIGLNILVMVAVKTKPQLRTKSNIALVCLSTTDLIVGLVLQPLHIANASLLLKGDIIFCTITEITTITTLLCIQASIHHLVLTSADGYVAIKHPFTHETQVTEVRIIMASALAWAAAIILSNIHLPNRVILIVFETMLIILPVYFNVSVYKEVRRNEKQIAANHVSLEAKERLLKKRKAFYTTVIVLLAILLCYIPSSICSAILVSLKERISSNMRMTGLFASTFLANLNSLFNPLIYAFRIRYFSVAFIHLLARTNNITQAEKVEKKIFGLRQIVVNGNFDPGQGSQKLNDEQ